MRQKRAKAYRKLMHLYSMSFGFRQPYQVLGMLILWNHRHYKMLTVHLWFLHLRTHTVFVMDFRYIRPCWYCECATVDSEMCAEAVASKMDLAKQLGTVLQGSVKPSEFSTLFRCPTSYIHQYLSTRFSQWLPNVASTLCTSAVEMHKLLWTLRRLSSDGDVIIVLRRTGRWRMRLSVLQMSSVSPRTTLIRQRSLTNECYTSRSRRQE